MINGNASFSSLRARATYPVQQLILDLDHVKVVEGFHELSSGNDVDGKLEQGLFQDYFGKGGEL